MLDRSHAALESLCAGFNCAWGAGWASSQSDPAVASIKLNYLLLHCEKQVKHLVVECEMDLYCFSDGGRKDD